MRKVTGPSAAGHAVGDQGRQLFGRRFWTFPSPEMMVVNAYRVRNIREQLRYEALLCYASVVVGRSP